MNASGPVPSLVGVRLLLAGAFLAWVVVAGGLAWLMLRTPHLVATWQESDVIIPGLTEVALNLITWMRGHWQLVATGALVPLVLLLVMRKAVVAVLALALIFAAGAVAGGLAVALYLPEAKMRAIRAYDQAQPAVEDGSGSVPVTPAP